MGYGNMEMFLRKRKWRINVDSLVKYRKYNAEVINGKTVINVHSVIEVDNGNLENRVRVIAFLKDMDLMDIAQKFGVKQKNGLLIRLRNGKLSFEEQKQLADILGVKLVNGFIFDDGRICEADNSKEVIRMACERTGRTFAELAGYMGVTRQGLDSKMKIGKFTLEELNKIAFYFGGKYVNYFEFDGMKI